MHQVPEIYKGYLDRYLSTRVIEGEGIAIHDQNVLLTHQQVKEYTYKFSNVLNEIAEKQQVVLPLHPRTRKIIQSLDINIRNLTLIDPVGYLNMVWLIDHCSLVMTDSGGLQKEAYFFGKACVTMRDQTEWVELIEVGANELVGANMSKIIDAATRNFGRKVQDAQQLYGGGKAAESIVSELVKAGV